MNGSTAATAIAVAAAAGVDYHSISFTIYISVVSAPLRSCAALYFVIIIIVIIFFRRCVSCRGSLNRSMCCTRITKHVFRVRHLSFRLIDFLRARSLAASIKNYGMRWMGWLALGLVRRIIVVVLVGGRSALCIYFTDGDRLHTILKLLPMPSHANWSAHTHTAVSNLNHDRNTLAHMRAWSLQSVRHPNTVYGIVARICYPLGACLDWFTMAFAIRCGCVSLFSLIEHPSHEAKLKMSIGFFYFAFSSLNIYRQMMPQIIRNRFSFVRVKCRHSTQLIWVPAFSTASLFRSILFKSRKCTHLFFYWRTRFVSISVNIVGTFIERARSFSIANRTLAWIHLKTALGSCIHPSGIGFVFHCRWSRRKDHIVFPASLCELWIFAIQ